MTPSNIKTKDILNCPYSGSAKQITLPPGTYKLECWGAQGGAGSYSSSGTAGKGGYSYGTLTLSSSTTVYLYVGGQGGTGSTSASGGYNGGGAVTYSGSTTNDCSGGGGASHIATSSGLLNSLSSSISSILLVAGGGGGVGWNWTPIGGYGGGTVGGNGSNSYDSQWNGFGGTQSSGGSASSGSPSSGSTTAGSFGQGGSGAGQSDGGAGGGGGFYGGGGGTISAGGGGSGYVNTSRLISASTIAGNTSFTSPTGEVETGHSGNGYVRISVIEVKSNLSIYIKNNIWKENDKILFKKFTNGNIVLCENMYIKLNSQPLMPNGYTELEYIESVGAQYIDTGLTVNKTDSYEMILIAHLINNDNWAGANGYLQFQAKIGNNKKSKIDIKYINKIETIFVDNQQVSSTDWSTSYNGTNVKLGIFKLGDTNNTWYSQAGQSGKLYSCKILNNNNLIRNFIPCKNTSGIAGLWDTINKQFYASASIADFTAGSVITTAIAPWVKIRNL